MSDPIWVTLRKEKTLPNVGSRKGRTQNPDPDRGEGVSKEQNEAIRTWCARSDVAIGDQMVGITKKKGRLHEAFNVVTWDISRGINFDNWPPLFIVKIVCMKFFVKCLKLKFHPIIIDSKEIKGFTHLLQTKLPPLRFQRGHSIIDHIQIGFSICLPQHRIPSPTQMPIGFAVWVNSIKP